MRFAWSEGRSSAKSRRRNASSGGHCSTEKAPSSCCGRTDEAAGAEQEQQQRSFVSFVLFVAAATLVGLANAADIYPHLRLWRPSSLPTVFWMEFRRWQKFLWLRRVLCKQVQPEMEMVWAGFRRKSTKFKSHSRWSSDV